MIAEEVGGKDCGFDYFKKTEDKPARGFFYKLKEGEPADRVGAKEILDACEIDVSTCRRVSKRIQMNSFKYPVRLHLTVLDLLHKAQLTAYREIVNGRDTTPEEAEVLALIGEYIGK